MLDLHFEIMHGLSEGKIICGVDEVGRGPLAGPVVAAAVILPRGGLPPDIEGQIRDSKQLSVKKREALFPVLTGACRYAVAEASVDEIDAINILQASLLAMRRAVEGLASYDANAGMEARATICSIDMALVDGNRAPALPCPAVPIVGGDGKRLSIAAASIIAKVTRDRFMKKLAIAHPGYGWEKNAGYGTAQHLAALREMGPTIWHRDSFAPVSKLKVVTG